MYYPRFLAYNIFGGFVWISVFLFGGYFFGNLAFVKNNLTFVTLVIIFISIIPLVIEYIKSRRTK